MEEAVTALFDEPIRVTLRLDRFPVDTTTPVGLLLGLHYKSREGRDGLQIEDVVGLVCLADGSISAIPEYAFTLDYRYDVENDRFVDFSEVNADQDDQGG